MKTLITVIAIGGLFTMGACNSSAIKEKDAALLGQQHTIDSMNTELAKKRVVDSMNEVSRTQMVIPQVIMPAGQSQAPVATSVSRSSRNNYSARTRTHHRSVATTQQAPVVAQRRRGWSAKAKGAVIGTATGAVVGGVVNKRNRAAGAIIGGILGAGAGTGVGAIIDKKHGR